jgi:hypothetical protein
VVGLKAAATLVVCPVFRSEVAVARRGIGKVLLRVSVWQPSQEVIKAAVLHGDDDYVLDAGGTRRWQAHAGGSCLDPRNVFAPTTSPA